MAVAGPSSARLFRIRPRPSLPLPPRSASSTLLSSPFSSSCSRLSAAEDASSPTAASETQAPAEEDDDDVPSRDDGSGGAGGGRGRGGDREGLMGSMRQKKKSDGVAPAKWLMSPDGLKWRDPTPGRPNWLGGDVPFPMNPWFRPPTPLSNALRSQIYSSFQARLNPSHPSSRSEAALLNETSRQWGVSVPRVEAIVRLKAMEQARAMDKKVPMEVHFEAGMERFLGVDRRIVKQGELDEQDGGAGKSQRKMEKRRRQFFGVDFVPLDEPKPTEQEVNQTGKPAKNRLDGYKEDLEPGPRQITGRDGLPRPSPFHVARGAGHVPLAFRDVSKFPRPMQKVSVGRGGRKKRVSRRLSRR